MYKPAYAGSAAFCIGGKVQNRTAFSEQALHVCMVLLHKKQRENTIGLPCAPQSQQQQTSLRYVSWQCLTFSMQQ